MGAYIAWTFIIVLGIALGVRSVIRERRDPRPVVVTERPSVTRVLIGGLLLGPIGALAGYAAKKKKRTRVG